MVFLAQKLFSMPSLYSDFKGFGKLGVSSQRLGWDYNILVDRWKDIKTDIASNGLNNIEEFVKIFATLSQAEISLVACFLFDQDFLDEKEKLKASEILQNKIIMA
jgi:hypothetical protein